MTGVEVVNLAQQALSETSAAHFLMDIEIDTDLLKDSLSVEVWEAYPDRVKLHVLSAVNPQLRQLAFRTDGRRSVVYYPHAGEALAGPPDLVKMPSVLESVAYARGGWIRAADARVARVVAREREDGLVVYKVEIPLGDDGIAQYWVDARDWFVRRVTYEDPYLGTGTIRVREMERLDYLPDAAFELQIPDGVPVTEIILEEDRRLTLEDAQQVASFPLRRPAYLPPDTTFESAYPIGQNIAMVYRGAHSFTFVQGPGIGTVPQSESTVVSFSGHQATLVPDETHGGLLLTWREGELQFSVAGLLDQEELVRIAESLERVSPP